MLKKYAVNYLAQSLEDPFSTAISSARGTPDNSAFAKLKDKPNPLEADDLAKALYELKNSLPPKKLWNEDFPIPIGHSFADPPSRDFVYKTPYADPFPQGGTTNRQDFNTPDSTLDRAIKYIRHANKPQPTVEETKNPLPEPTSVYSSSSVRPNTAMTPFPNQVRDPSVGGFWDQLKGDVANDPLSAGLVGTAGGAGAALLLRKLLGRR